MYNIEEFRRVLCKIDTLKAIEAFVNNVASNDATAEEAYQAVRARMISNACSAVIWRMNGEANRKAGFQALREKVGALEVIKKTLRTLRSLRLNLPRRGRTALRLKP